MSDRLTDALCNPALYPHPVTRIQLIETHISRVILTGPRAYKIKKPVNFGFLDFTTLAARKHFCEQELLLNQRMAPELYLEVLPITGTPEAPVLGGSGEPIEYALCMREFPQDQLLDQVQRRGELTSAHIDALAGQIARFHNQTPAIPASHPLNTAQAIVAPMRQNFEQIRPLLDHPADLTRLDALEAWTETSISRLQPLLEQRCQNGMIRECHGDLHLGNATLLEGRVVLFDCIEFNEPFRMIDIASDAAFLAMDLEDRGLRAQSSRFINGWLEQTGDYAALPLLNLYKAYRALVRAKVGLFRLHQETDPAQREAILVQYRSYASLAEGYSQIPARILAITHGVSASGKSAVALRVVESIGAIRVRSDVERKRLPGQAETPASTALDSGWYRPEITRATYQRLHELAGQILQAGFSVVLDATYLYREQRQAAQDVAETRGVPFLLLDCHAPLEQILQWLAERQTAGQDPSEATAEVIQAQLARQQTLEADERPHSLRVETWQEASYANLEQQLRRHFSGL